MARRKENDLQGNYTRVHCQGEQLDHVLFLLSDGSRYGCLSGVSTREMLADLRLEADRSKLWQNRPGFKETTATVKQVEDCVDGVCACWNFLLTRGRVYACTWRPFSLRRRSETSAHGNELYCTIASRKDKLIITPCAKRNCRWTVSRREVCVLRIRNNKSLRREARCIESRIHFISFGEKWPLFQKWSKRKSHSKLSSHLTLYGRIKFMGIRIRSVWFFAVVAERLSVRACIRLER
ncbi:uncharacterized protein LOC143357623 [Halictus rubicundus]|uniref:uncharacterized protein LOC143357623 n=1 Tax=Halictus rubicundus TaxID=77578 RepID=UPI004034FBF8